MSANGSVDLYITIGKVRPYAFIEPRTALGAKAIKLLDDHLSYMVSGATYSEAYRLGMWDGKIHLLRMTKNGTSYYIPLGVLFTSIRLLEARGVSYTISDTRPAIKARRINYKWHGPELRDYQQKAVEMVKKTFEMSYGGCVMSAPTGSGKTLIACKLIHDLGPSDTMVLVHTVELLEQWEKSIRRYLGALGSSTVTVTTMQSYKNAIDRDGARMVGMLIVDEVHHVPANTFYRVALNIGARYRLGLSATPRREDGHDLKIIAGIGPVVKVVSPAELFNNGSLVKPTLIVHETPQWVWRGGRRSFENEYKWGIVYNQPRNQLIADIVKQYADEGRKVYVHVTRIEHGKTLSKLTGAPFVYSESSDRDEVIGAFRKNKISVLISTLLGEGVDIPEMDVIILACGGKSQTALIQRIGRVMRPSKGKNEAIVVDFIDHGRWLSKHSEERINTFREYYEG